MCHKPTDPKKANPHFPFCSERCKLLDLGKWLDGGYVVTASSPFDEALDTLNSDTPLSDTLPSEGLLPNDPSDGNPSEPH